ncbi:hypothetical protein DCS_00769 [Drechmeria coniospora]|uniref:E3 ubiquitin-protein ligase synoviolin-like TPR repeats domain-containing protein n=1 Tax=Drechmeria coniospora TaxID=98403 RepID=A0A151GRA9_DRECN|nr:hypothetical protein DCS_00769 [Drechmeria coniospora]KYK59636.1 hypothetical protein DCS_00769 [Drechmeria coniospora]
MRLGWYAGVSTALTGGIIIRAFYQRANFYSAMVYLAQSNFCLLSLVNFTLLLYSSFIYGLTRLCYGTLRAVEVEQLTERAWFAITETCLAMTIFREEIGAWFLVMFTALVTGKVWGWIGDGRVEFLEQQPPPNPRLFHLRLGTSLSMSFLYDIWILRYAIHSVIQQARPNMMVMFLFEFAVLATCSWRTGARYILVLVEQNIIKKQTKKRLQERLQLIREQRDAMISQRELAAASGEETPLNQESLPSEDDVDEMDIEVPGWAAKGEWVLWLDLLTDMIKLGIYVAFFVMLLTFYGLPIHIMRDLFMTSRDFIKRLNALLRYRRAIQEMNRYPDATAEDLAPENTCIICREEMRPWDAANNSTTIDRAPENRGGNLRILAGGAPQPRGEHPPENNNQAPAAQGRQNDGVQRPQAEAQPRVFNLGPIRLGFAANGQQVRDLAQQFGLPQLAGNAAAPPTSTTTSDQPTLADNLQSINSLIQQSEQMVQVETQRLQLAQQELQVTHLLMAELQRLQQRRQQSQDSLQTAQFHQPLAPFRTNAFPQPPRVSTASSNHPQYTSYPMFSGVPPQLGSPPMARFGVSPASTVAIPADSPDLPDGVTLPPGWSLMPLQRLDGAPNHSWPVDTSENAPRNQDMQAADQMVSESTAQVTSEANELHGQADEPVVPPAPIGETVANSSQETRLSATTGSATAAHPSPSASNSGSGSSQLFDGASCNEQKETAQTQSLEAHDDFLGEATDQTPVGATRQPSIEGRATEREGLMPSGNGKGRAVTVEDTNDGD